MKKSAKGEVVLSACQIQATRLNKLEYHRLQRDVNLLREDFQEQMSRIRRQEQGLKLHYTNVVRVIKPNRSYQLWKQAHAREIAQDEAIEAMKLKQKSKPKNCKQPISSSNEISSEPPLRPLLLLLNEESKKPTEPIFNITNNFLRPKTSPNNQEVSTQHRVNPLLNMIDARPFSSNGSRQQQYDSPSFYSLSSMGATGGSRKLVQGKFINTHNKSNLDALYRMALQNQTAYKSVAQTRIEDRKLHDKEFASQHRALKGSMRSASVAN